MKMWFCFTGFYVWQTDTESGGNAAEACSHSKKKQELGTFFSIMNEVLK